MARRVLLPAAAPDSALHHLLPHFARIRAVVENQQHRSTSAAFQRAARPGTGGTESTQTMGKVAAEMCSVTGASMAAELLRQTSVIHRFPTHAARTARIWPYIKQTVERSDERFIKG